MSESQITPGSSLSFAHDDGRVYYDEPENDVTLADLPEQDFKQSPYCSPEAFRRTMDHFVETVRKERDVQSRSSDSQ